MAAHSANPACANCHAIFDPLGLALENFDGVGQWRNLDGGVMIDASGTFTGWQPFQWSGRIPRRTAEVSGRVLYQHDAAASRVRAWPQGPSLAAL